MKRDELTADIAESINMKGSSCNLTNVKRFALLIGSNRASSSVADIITNRCTSMISLAVLFAKSIGVCHLIIFSRVSTYTYNQ